MTFLHRLALLLLRKSGLASLEVLYRSSELAGNGWFQSFDAKASLAANGDPLPWFTYPAIDFLTGRTARGLSVFEYGCGAGTLWWASRVREVVACEHDLQWYQKVRSTTPDNVELFHVELEYGGAYARKILDYRERFDVVIIDGRDRVNCALNCLAALTPAGVVIIDDSDRSQYAPAYRYLQDHGFRRLELKGMGPGIPFKFETSIFYRDGNVLGI